MNEDYINVNPETGEVEDDPTMLEKIGEFAKGHCGLIFGVLGVILGSIGAIIRMRNADNDEEEDIEDAGDE